MRIGMNLMLWTFNPSYDEHGELLDRLKGFGYDAFEIGIGELSGPNIRRFAARAVELDLEPQAVDLFPVTVGDMISSDPAMRRAELLSGKVPTIRVRLRISRFRRSMTLFVRICVQCSGGKSQ